MICDDNTNQSPLEGHISALRIQPYLYIASFLHQPTHYLMLLYCSTSAKVRVSVALPHLSLSCHLHLLPLHPSFAPLRLPRLLLRSAIPFPRCHHTQHYRPFLLRQPLLALQLHSHRLTFA